MQSKQITMRQRNKEKKLKMSSTLTWLLDWKKRGDLANKTKALTKGERLKNGFGQWETLNLLLFHVSLICKLTHTSRAAHIAVKDKGKRSRASLCLCFWEKQKEGEQQQLLVGGGVGQSQLQRHTDGSLWKERFTCARLLSCHILIPGRALWEPTLTPTPTPLDSSSTPVIQHWPRQHFHLCAAVVRYALTNTFTKATPTTGLPHVCQEHQVGWEDVGFLFDVVLVSLKCALHFYCYLREKKTLKKKKREINLLFKIFIFEGWLCWHSESRDLVAVLYY